MTNLGRRVARALLAGPGAIAAASAVTGGMAIWLPKGEAQVDQIVFPLLLLPVILVLLFLYVCLETSMRRATVLLTIISAMNACVLAMNIMRS